MCANRKAFAQRSRYPSVAMGFFVFRVPACSPRNGELQCSPTADLPRTSPGPCGGLFAQCSQFSNCTGTVRTTTMMLTVSILPLVVLLSERASRAFCGPTSDGNGVSANGTAGEGGAAWIRPYGALMEEDHAFYTLDDGSPRATTLKPRPRSPKKHSKLRREPRFISFETKDNNIEVEIDFAIPFLSIPIQKSMNGVMNSVLKGTPLLNVNLGAVALAGVLTAGGALIGAAARTFSNSSLLPSWNLPLTRDQRSESRHNQVERVSCFYAPYCVSAKTTSGRRSPGRMMADGGVNSTSSSLSLRLGKSATDVSRGKPNRFAVRRSSSTRSRFSRSLRCSQRSSSRQPHRVRPFAFSSSRSMNSLVSRGSLESRNLIGLQGRYASLVVLSVSESFSGFIVIEYSPCCLVMCSVGFWPASGRSADALEEVLHQLLDRFPDGSGTPTGSSLADTGGARIPPPAHVGRHQLFLLHARLVTHHHPRVPSTEAVRVQIPVLLLHFANEDVMVLPYLCPDDPQEASLVWTLLGSLDRAMERYDIDTVACAQRTVCWYVKEATVAVSEGRAGPIDTIVEGLSRADWMGRFTASTAIEPAIRAGRKQATCEQTFPDCAITSFVEKVVRSARKRRYWTTSTCPYKAATCSAVRPHESSCDRSAPAIRDGLVVIVHDRVHQWRSVVPVAYVNGSSVLQQILHHLDVTLAAGHVQRRPTVDILARAASGVMSYPGMIPTSCNCRPVSYRSHTEPSLHWVQLTMSTSRALASRSACIISARFVGKLPAPYVCSTTPRIGACRNACTVATEMLGNSRSSPTFSSICTCTVNLSTVHGRKMTR
uniref:Uncharacterized protein n=1 Tax=Anopheles atroparvus TaxID=41427 RepID=A0A182JFM3_ANOAO